MTNFKNWVVCSAVMLMGVLCASAFTSSDADAIFTAYNTAFYVTNNGKSYYKSDTGTGTGAGWWTFAEEIEMAEDAYESSPTANKLNLITTLCNGFSSSSINGTNWTGNSYNDDITWAVIAFSRAYLLTGNTTYRNIAKFNFDAMYARAWDTNFTGGGLWWNTSKTCKNACINGPAAVAACYLYNIYGDSAYLTKAQNCYAWERRVLYHSNTGAIDDSISTNYVNSTWASTYNQGTFIGAGNLLYRATGLFYYYEDARLATKYSQSSSMSSASGILPVYQSGDLAGFNGILIRWMARMAKDQNLWSSYAPWLNNNGNAAWNVRNTNNLSWYNWTAPTPAGTNVLASWDCSDSVVITALGLTNAPDALLITPSIGFTAVSQYTLLPYATSLNLVLTNTSASALNWSLACTSAWLTVSANTGTIASGASATSVNVALIPSATTNMLAGHYYATVWLTNTTSSVVQNRQFTLVISSGNAPLLMTGYNAGVLAPNTATAAAPNATAFDSANNYSFFQAGLNISTRGLPADGVFNSQLDSTTVFQLRPYGGLNTLMMGNTYPGTGTLTLVTPQAYNSLAILSSSANGGGLGTFVLNFTNGTQSQVFSFNAQDWYSTTNNSAIQGMGRLKLGASLSVDDAGAANPNFYQTTLNLAALGLNQAISSITFTKPSSAVNCGVFAISGVVMAPAPSIGLQPQSVTNTLPAVGATFTTMGTGISPLAYQWYSSPSGAAGTYLPLALQTNTSLTLSPTLQTSNAASFIVVVTNLYGSVTSSVATLTVYRAPVITQQPAPTNVYRFSGATNTWSVTATAALPVNYYWYQNGTVLPSAVSSIYQVNNLQTTNTGNYTVVVSNAFGSVTSSVVSLKVATAPSYPFGLAILTDHPLAFWRLDEAGGTIAHDYVSGNNGTYSSKVLFGQTGYNLLDTHKAVTFGSLSTTNSCVTNISLDFGTTGNAAFSVEAWVNGGTQTTDAGLVTKGYGGGGEQFNLDCGGTSHAFRFFVRDAGGGTHLATSSVIPNSQWHHLVGVCDEPNSLVTLYVDGTNASQVTLGSYVGVLSSSTPVSIGSRQSGSGTSYNNQFLGSMEEVAIYGYALTAAQVQTHFKGVTNRTPVFVGNPFSMAGITAGQSYSATLTTNASDPNGDALTFTKVSGPTWMTVASNGSLSGRALSANVGLNTFLVRATDPSGLYSTATMNMLVTAAPPIVMSAVSQGNSLTLNWSGGVSPYQVQTTTNLATPDWQNLGVPLSVTSLGVSPTNDATFFRIYGQ